MSTLSPPKERLDIGDGTGLGKPWHVIVLNDDHNTFQGVAFALSAVLPGVDYDEVTDTLEAEGVQKFSDSFEEIVESIRAKRGELAAA